MSAFTENRLATRPDELWLPEHAPLFTLGQAGMIDHVLAASAIPVIPWIGECN